MPLFEIESGGKRFEVDAPDQQSAIGALKGQKSVSGFLSNLASNAQEFGGHLVGAASQPVESLKNVGKLVIGMGQQFVPGQQEYETTHADPFYGQLGRDLGFKRGQEGIEWDSAQLGENLYERPVDVALSASMATGGPGAVLRGAPGAVGTVGRGLTQASKYTNPLYAPTKAVTTVAKRAITPFPARPGAASAAQALRQEGVEQTAGQATGSKSLKYTESELGGGRVGNMLDQQGEQFTRAASRRIGLDTPHLDGPTMESAYTRIGGEIGTVASRNTLNVDSRLMREAYNAAGEYNRQVPQTMRVPAVAETLAEIQALRGRIPGDRYQSMRSMLGEMARGAGNDPHLQRAMYGLQRSLDDAMERSVSPADRGALQNARRQYRNYLVLEKAMATGGQETAAGIVTPARLEQALSQVVGKRGYLHGRHDFGSLAKAGKIGMSKMPESGTSFRTAARVIPGMIGGALAGGGSLDIAATMGALGGATAGGLAGRALMSRPVQSYLGNQAMSRVPSVPQGAQSGGRLVTQAAARQEALKQAENVLSPQVLDHIKKSPNTRSLLNDWLKARYAGDGIESATAALAEAIAAEVKRPELAARIAEELSGAEPRQTQ